MSTKRDEFEARKKLEKIGATPFPIRTHAERQLAGSVISDLKRRSEGKKSKRPYIPTLNEIWSKLKTQISDESDAQQKYTEIAELIREADNPELFDMAKELDAIAETENKHYIKIKAMEKRIDDELNG